MASITLKFYCDANDNISIMDTDIGELIFGEDIDPGLDYTTASLTINIDGPIDEPKEIILAQHDQVEVTVKRKDQPA